MLRFMVLGGVACSLYTLERAAAAWGTTILIDSPAFEGAQFLWQGRLLGAVIFEKRGHVPLRLYSMEGRTEGTGQDLMEEWMYQLASLPKGQFDEVNAEKDREIRDRFNAQDLQRQDSNKSKPHCPTQEEFGEGTLWYLEGIGLSPLLP
eukprot:Hpha_TRINITY_DN15718_c2_g3::TRINITY_DN15718_c2_g3_i2::g.41454::m.41454